MIFSDHRVAWACVTAVVVALTYANTLRTLLREAAVLNRRITTRHPDRRLLKADHFLSIVAACLLAAVWTPFVLLADLLLIPAALIALVGLIAECLEGPWDWCENLLVALVVWIRRGFGGKT